MRDTNTATSTLGRGLPKKGPEPSRHERSKAFHVANLRAAPRCGARTRSGSPCQQAAVRGKARCRMHGGAKGSGGPPGQRNGAWKDGGHTNEAKALRRDAKRVLSVARAMLSD